MKINFNKFLARFSIIALSIFLASCSTITGIREKPKFTLVEISPDEIGLFEQKFILKVRISNPNDVELPINGIQFKVKLNQQNFASAMSGEHLQIPRYGDQVVTLRAYTSSLDWLKNYREITSLDKQQAIKYQVDGSISSDSIFGTIDFTSEGEISVDKLIGEKKKKI